MFFFIALFSGCNRNDLIVPKDVRKPLQIAGNNRNELEKVINYYSHNTEDKLKLEACFFLIKNMSGHYSYTSSQLEGYNEIFDLIYKKEKLKPLRGDIHYPVTNHLWDSLASVYGPLDINRLSIVNDLNVISSKQLIENIDYSFIAWSLPWASQLSFNEFCNYILPYRFANESLESWRLLYFEKFKWVIDTCLKYNITDPVDVCKIINDDISKWFRFNALFHKYPGAISARNLLKTKMGKCLDQAGIANFAMRALGVPVVHEFIPQWADHNMGHDFSAVLNKNGAFIDFLGGELPPGKNEIRNVPPKIFRNTFTRQRNPLLIDIPNINNIPPKLNNSFFIDVTKDYIPVSDIEIELKPDRPKAVKYVYLCTFNNYNWVPVYYSRIKHGKAVFINMGRKIIYLPAYYLNKHIIPAANPIIVDSTGNITPIQPDYSQEQTVVLKRKYPLTTVKKWWMTWMGGGLFQASNKPDFTKPVDLYIIPDTIDLVLHYSRLNSSVFCRYVRYKFPDNRNGSLGEIAFYGENNQRLEGKPIKAMGVEDKDVVIAFDGLYNKFIHTPKKSDYNGKWIGLDLGSRKKVTAIAYCPRTDENNIYQGMTYELRYWDNVWKSLGIKTANGNKLIYDNVPVGALLWLRNHTEGKEERIFIWENEGQVWW